jgi:hypothetical protein
MIRKMHFSHASELAFITASLSFFLQYFSLGHPITPHFRPRSPLNLFTFGAVPALEEGLAVVDERSLIAPSPVVLPSNRSQGATSALRGVGPVLPPPIASRAVGGSGQSIVEAALEAALGLRCASG